MSEREAGEHVSQLLKKVALTQEKDSTLDIGQLELTGRVSHDGRVRARGHFADVYKGETLGEKRKLYTVAVKTLRLPCLTGNESKYETIILRFYRELSLWAKLKHVNVARLLGYTNEDGNISLILHWYKHGNLVEYLRARPQADKNSLMIDVARGVRYLHTRSPPLVHGDLKAANILVGENGIARLADFGVSRLHLQTQSGLTTSSNMKGMIPWMAPELHSGSPLTPSSDVYSCAGVFIQLGLRYICCPGKIPFENMTHTAIIIAQARGGRPDRSEYPEMERQDALWQLMCSCWDGEPDKWPTIRDVLRALYDEFKLSRRGPSNWEFNPFKGP